METKRNKPLFRRVSSCSCTKNRSSVLRQQIPQHACSDQELSYETSISCAKTPSQTTPPTHTHLSKPHYIPFITRSSPSDIRFSSLFSLLPMGIHSAGDPLTSAADLAGLHVKCNKIWEHHKHVLSLKI